MLRRKRRRLADPDSSRQTEASRDRDARKSGTMEQPKRAAEIGPFRAGWAFVDGEKRRQGELMDRLGLGPVTTPSRTVRTWRTATLRAYQEPARPSAQRPALLIVPAPIKSAYIWDLAPDVSVVRRSMAAGLQTYLVDWGQPQPEDEGLGLEQYAYQTIVDCLDAVSAETMLSTAFIAGHSLGGTLAAIFASLRPERLQGLVEVEGPMEFNPGAGRLEAAVALAPSAKAITEALANVPGSFMSAASSWVDPMTFRSEPLIDWMRCCLFPTASATYLKVRRWTLDEKALPRRLFEEVIDHLYRENRFADGKLVLGQRPVDPHDLTAPILAVSDPRSRIIPPISIQAYRHRTGSTDVQILEYEGDFGVMLQHVGVLVGRNAHRSLWPRIFGWMRQRSPLCPQ
jgi:polyhydroxyalkanoate synthase subunit PhaC